MDVELFVHGVPSGEGFWGKEDDRNYFGTFYDHSSDDVKLLIQTRTLKGKSYCYYNYLVYKTAGSQVPNVVANDGRDGSYFGITLRFDAYCKDFANMYRILDTVFNVYVMGSLLKMEKTKLKYTTPDFTSVSNVLDGIEKSIIQLIQNAFSNDSFVRLDGFATSGGNCPTRNLYDCTLENVMSAVKQYSRVAISPYFQSSKEATIQQEHNSQIQNIQQQYENRLKEVSDVYAKEKNEISSSLDSANRKISHLQNEIRSKDADISQLENNCSNLQLKIQNVGQNKKVSQIVSTIKEPIIELSTIMRELPETHKHIDHIIDTDKTKKRVSIFSVIKKIKSLIPLLNLLLLLVVVWILLTPSINHVPNPNQNTAALSDSSNVEITTREEENAFNKENTQIVLQNNDGSYLLKGKNYNVTISGTDSKGYWEGVGCSIQTAGDPYKVIVMPTANEGIIRYHVGSKCKEIHFKAK